MCRRSSGRQIVSCILVSSSTEFLAIDFALPLRITDTVACCGKNLAVTFDRYVQPRTSSFFRFDIAHLMSVTAPTGDPGFTFVRLEINDSHNIQSAVIGSSSDQALYDQADGEGATSQGYCAVLPSI